MKNVLVFLAPGFEEVEAVTPVDYLRRAGCNVILAAVPSKGEACSLAVKGAHGIEISADVVLEDFLKENPDFIPDAVFAPGGMPGSANIAADDLCCRLIKKTFESGNVAAAICAAPVVVFAKTGVLAGKKYTCYPGMEQSLPSFCGSAYPIAVEGSEHVSGVSFVKDGNVLTGVGPGGAEQFALEFVSMLCGPESSSILKKQIVARL